MLLRLQIPFIFYGLDYDEKKRPFESRIVSEPRILARNYALLKKNRTLGPSRYGQGFVLAIALLNLQQ